MLSGRPCFAWHYRTLGVVLVELSKMEQFFGAVLDGVGELALATDCW
jgi:hypothetical protein